MMQHAVIYNQLIRVNIAKESMATDIYDLLPDKVDVYFEVFQKIPDGRWLLCSRKTSRKNIWVHYFGGELHDRTPSPP